MSKLLPKKADLQKVAKQEGRLVLLPERAQLNKAQIQADLAALQTGKAAAEELAAILARLLQRLLEEP